MDTLNAMNKHSNDLPTNREVIYYDMLANHI